jgi:Zn-dependent protease with chaperone function
MHLARRLLPALCLVALLTALPPLSSAAQPARVAPAANPAAAQPATGTNAQAYSLPADKLAKAINFNRILNVLDILDGLWGLAVLWLLLSTRAAAGLEAWTQRVLSRRWLQGLLFFVVLIAILDVADLPLNLFGHLASLHYGISVEGWSSWVGDHAKELGIALAGAPVLLLFNWMVRVAPRRYWLWIWVATVPLMVLTVFGEPLLEPIFNKFEPLAKNYPALVAELEKVVARTGTHIPPDRMFLMQASSKSSGLNAYVSGLGATKRIVVWDTAAGRIPDDEILFIFGHESGHYVLNHIPKMLTGFAIALFFVYWACGWFAAALARRYGERWGLKENGTAALASRAGFVVLLFAVSVAAFVLEPAGNAFSRHFEHQADVYGQEAIHGLVPDAQKTAVCAFNHLGEAWLEDPDPSPAIEFWLYNHPSVKNRANFAAHYDPWANGGQGEFFDK